MEDYYFKFEFSSIHNKIKSINYYVLAETMDDLRLFMAQHGFKDAPPESIELLPKNNMGKYSHNCLLEEYKFKSNNSDEVFSVMTCWTFINDTVNRISNDLNEYMLFGEAIIRRDVEIFKVIGDLVSGLDFGHVIDFMLCDYKPEDETDEIVSDQLLYQLQKEYMKHIGKPTEDVNVTKTYEDLFNSVDDDEDNIMPVTIECYISNFTEMMMDVFE